MLEMADGIVLPGVGAFRDGMENLSELSDCIKREAEHGKPLLGICLGMQMLLTESEEGGVYEGLDIIPGKVVRFESKGNNRDNKIPHMGWNSIKIKENHWILDGIEDNSYFYFVHSYYTRVASPYEVASCTYITDFSAVIATKNVVGTQFHPEKSGDTGLRILHNFVRECRR